MMEIQAPVNGNSNEFCEKSVGKLGGRKSWELKASEDLIDLIY